MPSSSSCVVKNKLRDRLVASTMLTIASGCSSRTYSLVMLSSGVNGDMEYAPGRSTAVTSLPPANSSLSGPSLRPTVTPAQLPTFSFIPVSALNMVVLPLLGLPAKAILIIYTPLSDYCDPALPDDSTEDCRESPHGYPSLTIAWNKRRRIPEGIALRPFQLNEDRLR